MNFLKSYAHQVVSYHPEKFRDELFDELYNELCEEFADWQLDHPGDDEAAFLDDRKDHPMRFATRLAPEGSAYLIGPQFYYSFLSALKIATIVVLGVHLFLGVITAMGSGVYFGSLFRMLMSSLNTLIWVYASIIGVFIALEKSGEKATWLDSWKARQLVPMNTHQVISKSETFFDLGLSVLALLWLLDIVQFPAMIRHDGIWTTGWTVNLPDMFWLVAGIMLVVDIAFCIFKLIRNFWSPGLRLMSIVFNIAWVAMLSYAATITELVSLGHIESAGILKLQPHINMGTHAILYLIIVILAADSLKHIWKLFKPRQPVATMDTP